MTTPDPRAALEAAIQPEWKLDCQGKQDYDADLLQLSCRYYPRGGGFSVLSGGEWQENDARAEINPSAVASILWGDVEIVAADFDGETEGEVKAKVERWADEQIKRILASLPAAAQGEAAWYAVATPGADFDASFVDKLGDADALADGDSTKITPLYTHPLATTATINPQSIDSSLIGATPAQALAALADEERALGRSYDEGGAELDVREDRLTPSAPPRIWLQADISGSDHSEPFPPDTHWEYVTWSADSIGGAEVEYIRADLAAVPNIAPESADRASAPDDAADNLLTAYLAGVERGRDRNEAAAFDDALNTVQELQAEVAALRNEARELLRIARAVAEWVYVECRECSECGHVGINDSHETDGACHECEWSGPNPAEDKCPGCGNTGCMAAACPKCSARYRLIAEHTFLRADAVDSHASASEGEG